MDWFACGLFITIDPTATPEVTTVAPTETAVPATIPPKPTATPDTQPTEIPPQTTLPIIIPGNHVGWLNTGIWLQAGDIYTVAATGIINIWPNCEETKAQEGLPNLDCLDVTQVTPEGTDAFGLTTDAYPYPNGNTAALVGRVDSAPSFMVGFGNTFTAETDGFLQFAINDYQFMEDNLGEFSALVTIPYNITPEILNGEWFNTGVMLGEGDMVTIAATGAIDMWPNCEETRAEQGYPDADCAALHNVSPNGTATFAPATGEYPLPNSQTMALVGRIGNDDVFLVGEGGEFTADTSGPLLLATNDTAYWRQDDQGTFTVVVTTENGEITYLDLK